VAGLALALPAKNLPQNLTRKSPAFPCPIHHEKPPFAPRRPRRARIGPRRRSRTARRLPRHFQRSRSFGLARAESARERETEGRQTRGQEFPSHWRVENGELINVGTGPYATTDEEFGDIELLIEYKTVPKADSGIYLRGVPQVQIWDKNQVFDPKKPDRKPHLGSGGLFNNTPGAPGRDPLVVADKPFGDWNAFGIRQIGARTWVWLNDKPVVDGAVMKNFWDRTKPLPAKGPIMLQTHGGEIRWRNIFVRDIPADEAARATR
jgi:Domain of Unknown Function (DUF1080)